MNPTILLIAAFLLVGVVPIALAYYLAKRFRMPDYRFSYWIILFAVFFGITVVATSYHRIKLGIDLRGGSILVYEVAKSSDSQADENVQNGEQKDDQKGAAAQDNDLAAKMNQMSATLKKRLDPSGVKEITVRQRGANAVEIIIPKADPEEIARLKRIISRSGTLEFRILADRRYPDPEERTLIEMASKSKDQVIRIKTGVDDNNNPTYKEIGMWIPVTEGREREFGGAITRTRIVRNKEITEVLCKKDIYNVTGKYLTSAVASVDEKAQNCVNFHFDAKGANLFGSLTAKNLPNKEQDLYRKLGIVLDGSMFSAPQINGHISSNGVITGNFTRESAQELATVLNSGSLPASLSKEPISEMTSGPTLGQDTIYRGATASFFALVAVLIFMAFYYRFAGLVADFALTLNLILLVAFMITFSAAFTLPGIAGLVMTLGMAVDANVLIYERMREERDKGATIHMAIRNGFQKAFSAIFDSNITTLLVGVILYWVGTEQIKGFAVTLILGIALSMFTALFCARIIFETADRIGVIKALRMCRIIGQTNIDFMGLMKKTGIVVTILCVGSVIAILARGAGLLDIDFTGGSSIQVLFNEEVPIDTVRKELSELENLAVSDVQISGEKRGYRYVINSSNAVKGAGEKQLEGEAYINHVTDLIKEKFGSKLATNDIDVKNCVPYAEKESILSARKAEQEAAEAKEEKANEAKEAPAETTTLNSVFDMFLSTAYADEPVKEEQAPAEQAKPAEEAPAAPAEQAAPAEEAPAAPAEEAPAAPAEEAPAAPAEEAPAAPAEEAPAAPAEEAPAAPAEEAPAAPAEEAPATPAEEAPAAPAEEAPAAPAEEAPAAPAEEAPATPAETNAAGNAVVTDNPDVAFAKGTFAVVEFKEAVTYDVAKTMVEDAMTALNIPEDNRLFTLENPYYDPNETSTAAFKTWDVSFTLSPSDSQKVLDKVKETVNKEPIFPARNMIGPQVASNLRTHGLWAIFGSLIVMVIYLWFRFQKVYYGFAATAALCNNVILSVGALAVSAYVCGALGFLLIDPFKIGLTVLAGIMTIIGYSLNDTIVVFDRIREVKGKAPRITPAMVNQAINDMLARTILTSVTTLLVIVVLYIWGGQAIHAFAFTMLVGVLVGTFSSIFIAAPLLCRMDRLDALREARAAELERNK